VIDTNKNPIRIEDHSKIRVEDHSKIEDRPELENHSEVENPSKVVILSAAKDLLSSKQPQVPPENPSLKGTGFSPSIEAPPEEGALAPEGQQQNDRPLAPGLYLVATPIGNLEDITLRALRVLRSVDRIACEDTRQTAKLLGHFGIRTPTVSYHTHNENSRATELIEALCAGGRIAVVSDAGMPGIADPGAILAAEAIAAGIAVYPIPGANAALSALIASGLCAERFAFHGFLPSKEGQRRTTLESLRNLIATDQVPQGFSLGSHGSTEKVRSFSTGEQLATHIVYETPHRILDALADIITIFGPGQRIVLARELTKLHEEFLRGTAAELLATLRARPSIRGEMVLLIDGTPTTSTTTSADTPTTSLANEVAALMRAESLSEKDALKRVAKSRGIGKSEAYRELQRQQSRKR
jgi:16S rRNA (cytidine1402-2'-O)-methyltransferase